MSDWADLPDGIVAKLNAYNANLAAYYALARSKAHMEEVLAPCPGPCPADYRGHWRHWHRGHGCEADIRGNHAEYTRAVSELVSATR